MKGSAIVTAVIVFGIILLVCAEEVIRLARDARADAERTPAADVFNRRWLQLKALGRRGRFLAAKPETRQMMNRETVFMTKPTEDAEQPAERVPART